MTGSFGYLFEYSNPEIRGKGDAAHIRTRNVNNNTWEVNTGFIRPAELFPMASDGLYDQRTIKVDNSYLASVYDRFGTVTINDVDFEINEPVATTATTDKAVSVVNWSLNVMKKSDSEVNAVESYAVRISMTCDDKNTIAGTALEHGNPSSGTRGNDYFYITINDRATGKLVTTSNGEVAEYVVSSNELQKGLNATFKHEHGPKSIYEINEVYSHPSCNNLEVHISYLYPFEVESLPQTVRDEDEPAPATLEPDYTTDILKSPAAKYNFSENYIQLSSVIDFEAETGVSVTAGRGYIMIAGGDADIYNVGGVKIATGSGTHHLASGVYIVACGNQRQKIVVK